MTSGTRSIRAGLGGMAAIVLKGSTLQVQYLRRFPVSALKFACQVSNASFWVGKSRFKLGLTFGNDAPTMRIFVKKDGRYLRAMTIAENDFVGH